MLPACMVNLLDATAPHIFSKLFQDGYLASGLYAFHLSGDLSDCSEAPPKEHVFSFYWCDVDLGCIRMDFE